MLELLNKFNFDSVDAETLSKTILCVKDFLVRAESHYTNMERDSTLNSPAIITTPISSSSIPSSHPPQINLDSSIAAQTEYCDDFLGKEVLQSLNEELCTLQYHRTGTNRPDVCLFGDNPYIYNKATQDLLPRPLHESPIISRALDAVNSKFGVTLNSVLVNRYSNKNVALDWHKDDEKEVNNSLPIISLSIGAVRRFSISDSKTPAGRTKMYTLPLQPNSVFAMNPGLQNLYFHRVEHGRGSIKEECGRRYSLTFRCILPDSEATNTPTTPTPPPRPTILIPTPIPTPTPGLSASTCSGANDHGSCPTTLVFGSSLTKGLKEDLLSQRGEHVKVFSHSGARIKDINVDMSKAVHTVSRDSVKSIFIVAGGNDVENTKSEYSFRQFMDDFDNFLDQTSLLFPNAHINIVSLIPRRVRNPHHLQWMIRANEELNKMCGWRENRRFIDVFSYFLVNKKRYFRNSEMHLNGKLFVKDSLHFSQIGNSVLAKVIIGAIYRPF